MSEFFKQAQTHAPETMQKRFFDAILRRQNIIGSFPQGENINSLYSFPALISGNGMAVVVCPDVYTVQRNVMLLAQAGHQFPDVAVLDGTQDAEQERTIFERINRNHIHLLYTTPERFASITFMQMLVHTPINFIAIEEAHWLLEGYSGSFRYWKLWEGLGNLQARPPLVLFTNPLSPPRLQELVRRLGLKDFQMFQRPPVIDEATWLTVKMAFNEQEKFHYLTDVLSGQTLGPSERYALMVERQYSRMQHEETESIQGLIEPSAVSEYEQPKKLPLEIGGRRLFRPKPNLGRLMTAGSVLVLTQGRKSAQKISGALHHYGVPSVLLYHPELGRWERLAIEEQFNRNTNQLVVAYGYGTRFLRPPRGQLFRVFHWQMPASLDELLTSMLQVSPDDTGSVENHVLYTREDYKAGFRRLVYESQHRLGLKNSQRRQAECLRQMRQWLLSDTCRLQSILAFWQGEWPTGLPLQAITPVDAEAFLAIDKKQACGVCDACRYLQGHRPRNNSDSSRLRNFAGVTAPSTGVFLRRLIRQWVY